MARILDLGCGQGRSMETAFQYGDDIVFGIDICYENLRIAKLSFPGDNFCCAAAEHLPLRSKSIDVVVCNVALPYMEIPVALSEIHRVAKPGARAYFSLHNIKFTLAEFRVAASNLFAVLFRIYVLLNGALFHVTGKLLRFPNGRIESWQSESAMRRAMERAGFTDIRATESNGQFTIYGRA